MDQPGRDVGEVTRGQNAVYVLPHDWASMSQFLTPVIERADATSPAVQVLVVTADAEAAAAAAGASVRLAEARNLEVVAATSAARATRILRAQPSQIVAGSTGVMLELIQGGAIKVDAVCAVVIAWADELIRAGGSAALESVMTDVPKDSARIVVAAELTPDVEALIERYAWRARRAIVKESVTQPTRLEYVTTSRHARLAALRRLLDLLDPSAALIYAHAEGEDEVKDLLRTLGYGRQGSPVRVGRSAEPDIQVTILFDLPPSHEALREAVGVNPQRVVAIVQPRQLQSLRALSGGGGVQPLPLPEAGQRARVRGNERRAELRKILESEEFGRELLELEPLLEEYDGIEIAAAALSLLDRERQSRAKERAEESPKGATTMVALFVNVGARDNARAGDITAALAAVPGVTSAHIGKIDIRDSHTIVQVAAPVAQSVVEKVTGTSIRGRRVAVRLDQPRERPAPRRDAGGGRGGGSRDRGDRPERRGPPRPRERR